MLYEVVFTPESEETFDLISNQLMDRFGLEIVVTFQNLTSSCIQKISENPFIYQILDEQNMIRKCNVHANCSILYCINDLKVVVICFWDNRQDPIFR